MSSMTPMLRQYNRAKRDHPGTIVLFRLGDFYEMFYEDARVASGILGIALTARGRGTEHEAPMCGIPYHAAEAYVSRLIGAGHRVALCDQVEEASKAKGLVKREVTRVLSPGTVTDPRALDASSNLYLASICRSGERIGVAYADLSTGDFTVAEVAAGGARQEVALQFAAFRPREILAPEGEDLEGLLPNQAEGDGSVTITRAPGWIYGEETSLRSLTDHFQTAGLEGFGCAHLRAGIRAAGAMLRHLHETQNSPLSHFTRIRPYAAAQHLILDETTQRTLEIASSMRETRREGTLIAALDRTVSPMGARLLRSWLLAPPLEISTIRSRHDAVEELFARSIERGELREALARVKDMERILGRLSLGTANARDLVALRESMAALPAVHAVRGRFTASLMSPAPAQEDLLADLESRISSAIADEPPADLHQGGIVRDGFSAELDDLRAISRDGRAYIASLESRERKRTGIASLKVRHNRVFGYYIEVSKANLAHVPADYDRKQTLVGAERYITPELKEYEEKVLTAQDRIDVLEHRIFCEVRDGVAAASGRIRAAASLIARLDALAGFAEIAAAERYVRPRMTEEGPLRIDGGRHPVVERASMTPFVPNGVDLGGEGPRVLIITGPNMGGKSTYLRQTALITLLAHAGSFVPADEATVPLVDRIFSRVGASDDLASGQSTFMVEMTETANILHNATSRSLVLLDEVGRGTATFDGLSLAWAIVEHLLSGPDRAPMTLFATHYHELTDLALTQPGVRNMTMAVEETASGVVFLRRVLEGTSDRSYGIHVAKLAGLPRRVIERAKEILRNLESDEVGRDGMPRLARRGTEKESDHQLHLFGGDSDPVAESVVNEIRALDPDAMTPLGALQLLAQFKQALDG